MTIALKIVGWLVVGCVAVCLSAMALAFCLGALESIRDRRKRQQRRAVKQEKRPEGGVKVRVVWPE